MQGPEEVERPLSMPETRGAADAFFDEVLGEPGGREEVVTVEQVAQEGA